MSNEDAALVQAITGLELPQALQLLLDANSNVELAIARHFDGAGVMLPAAPQIPPPSKEEPRLGDDDVALVDPNLVVKDVKTGQVVPLLGLKVAARVNQTIAEVSISLRFENSSPDCPLEAVFQLADEDIIVHAFEVCIGDTIVQGQCMEKQEAFAKYDDAISSGNTAFLAEKKSKRQTFDISAGNLAPGMVCVVHLRYTTMLDTVEDKFVFGLPVTRTVPVSAPSTLQLSESAEDLNAKLRAQVPDGLNVTVAVSQPQRILDLICPSHQCEIERLDVTGRVTLSQKELTPARFETFITVSDVTQAFCVTEAVAKDASAMEVSSVQVVGAEAQPRQAHEIPFDFGPQPGMQGVHSAGGVVEWKKYALSLSFVPRIQTDLDMSTEVIFILDCSGSMAGGRMRRAKSALALFLRALPESARFNIVRFGDRHNKLFATPLAYNDATLKQATQWLDQTEAKMGGTNLLAPFEDVLTTPLDAAYPTRQIFLLTDGDVANKDDVLQCIRKHVGEATRIFAFAIGNEVSQALMRGIARFGRGKAEFVESTTPLEAPVMRQVTRAMQPVLTKFQVDWGTLRAPPALAPIHFPPIFDGERFDYHSFFEAPVGGPSRHEIVVKAFAENQAFEFPVVVDLSASDLEMSVQRFAAHAAIRDMELSANRAGLKKDIVDLAVKYQLASKYTSFVAVHVNENQSATGHMVRMDVDEAIHQSKAGFLDMASEKLEEISRGVDDMLRSSGNFLSSKLNAFSGSAAGTGARARARVRRDSDPVWEGAEDTDSYSDHSSSDGDYPVDDSDGLLRKMSKSESNYDAMVDDDIAIAAADEELMMADEPQSVTSRLKDSVSSWGSAVVAKMENLMDSASAAVAPGGRPAAPQTRAPAPAAPPKPMSMDISESEQAATTTLKTARRHSKKESVREESKRAPSKEKAKSHPAPPPPAASYASAINQRADTGFAPKVAASPRGAAMPLQQAMPIQQALPPKASSAMDLIVHAQANGSFLLDAVLASLLGKTLAALLDLAPAALKQYPDVWATALVLAALEKHFSATKDEWGLIHTKGRKFIAKTISSHSIEATVDTLIQSASEAL